MKKIIFIGLSVSLLSSSALLADKPSWAGNGSKPSEYEKEYHKNDMRSKNEHKKYKKEKKDKHHKKHDKKNNYDRDYDRDYKDDKYRYSKDYDRDRNYNDGYNGQMYEGQGQSDGEFIEQKKDETKKNWIGKFFDFLN